MATHFREQEAAEQIFLTRAQAEQLLQALDGTDDERQIADD